MYHKMILHLKEYLHNDRKTLHHQWEKTAVNRRQLQRKRIAIVLLVPVFLCATVPARAEGTQQAAASEEQIYTLAQIIEQVQRHNRIGQQYALNLKLLDENQTKARNARDDVQSTLNSVYDQESLAYNSLGTVGKNQSAVSQGMQAIQKQVTEAGIAQGLSGQELQNFVQNQLQTNSSYLALQAQSTALTGMESQLNSGIVSAESAIEQLWDGIDEVDTTLRTLENKQDDVEKSQADWNEEVKLVTNLLVRKTNTTEHSRDLLEEKYALLQKQLVVAQKQEEIGLSVPVKTKDIQISLEETATQLQQVKDGIQLLKRQLNDMMGRPLDAPLSIAAVPESGYVSIAPVYSADLLKQARDNDYTLKTLQRDIDNYKEDAQDLKDQGKYESDTLKIYDLNIELSKVAIRDEEAAVDNDLKKLINAVNVTGQTYNEKLDAWRNAQTRYEQNQKYKEVGLLSPLKFQAAELEYKQTELARQQAAYDYALTKLEYEAFLKGVDLSIYEKYKGL